MSQQICISYWNHKICRKATPVRLFSIFWNLMSNGIQVPSEFVWRTKFFPTSWTVVFSQVWRRSIFKFCVYKLAEDVRFLKFKWEFVIIGRGCLVLRKFKSSLCWRMLCFKALHVNPTSWPPCWCQWIIILKTLELVTLSFSQFHAQRNWLLTHTLHIFTTTTTTNFIENGINIFIT